MPRHHHPYKQHYGMFNHRRRVAPQQKGCASTLLLLGAGAVTGGWLTVLEVLA